MADIEGVKDFPVPGKTPWPLKYSDPHAHDWSGWAGVYRDGHEVCLKCGVNRLEDSLLHKNG